MRKHVECERMMKFGKMEDEKWPIYLFLTSVVNIMAQV